MIIWLPRMEGLVGGNFEIVWGPKKNKFWVKLLGNADTPAQLLGKFDTMNEAKNFCDDMRESAYD